jgi:hypothetical protein
MRKIKWDDKYFEQSGLLVWVFSRGHIESSNERFYKSSYVCNDMHRNNRNFKRRKKKSIIGSDWVIKR